MVRLNSLKKVFFPKNYYSPNNFWTNKMQFQKTAEILISLSDVFVSGSINLKFFSLPQKLKKGRRFVNFDDNLLFVGHSF